MPWTRHRRGRLPGRGRLREFVTNPSVLVQATSPQRLRVASSQRVPERLIGLLMIRNESDVLAESLAVATQWFDRIFVLDGTDEPERAATDAILAATPEVEFVVRDQELATEGPVRDGARQVLLEEVRRRYGVDNWIGILHADEFIEQDPRPLLGATNPVTSPTLRVRLVHGFLHAADEPVWAELTDLPVRQRIRHFMWPGVPETRFFYDNGTRDYEVSHHGKTVPLSFRNGPLIDGFIVLHFNERSPSQIVGRAEQRRGDGWQQSHYQRFVTEQPETFVESLDSPRARFAPEFVADPLGPFVARHADTVPSIAANPSHRPVITTIGQDTDRAVVDLAYVVEHGGLADLVDLPGRRATQWADRLTSNTDYGEFVRAPGARPLLDYTERILSSTRTDRRHRLAVAAEFVERFFPADLVEQRNASGWLGVVDELGPQRQARLHGLLPHADFS